MKMLIKVVITLSIIIGFTACTKSDVRQVVGSAVANGADTQIRYSAYECTTLQQSCVQGDFQEWQTSDKEIGCSCKKL